MSQGFDSPKVAARGYTAYNRRASTRRRAAARAIDIFAASLLFLCILLLSQIHPFPRWSLLFAYLGTVAGTYLAQRALLGRTLGDLAWSLKPAMKGKSRGTRFNPVLLEPDRMSGSARWTAISLTLALVVSMSLAFRRVVLASPAWMRAELVIAFAENLPPDAWSYTPFFYSLGAWPKQFRNQPVFHTLPYEKGPPTRFVGHIIARWDMPEIRLTIEGPKTPIGAPFANRVLVCMSQILRSDGCVGVRRSMLERHLQEMSTLDPSRWQLQWLKIENPDLKPEQLTQGLWISASNGSRAQDRFIAVTPAGNQQTFILDRPESPSGDEALKLFKQSIQSLRVFDELGSGRAWIDRQIQEIKLDQAHELADYARIQTLLLSKISVDPKPLEPYYHLGGTAAMLIKKARSQPAADWGAAAKQLLLSTWRFAKDVAPRDPKTKQLENLWLDTQK